MLEESIDSSPNSLNSSIRRKREHRKTKRTRLNDLLLQRSHADHSQLNQLYYDDSEQDDLLLPATHGNSFKRFHAENMMAKADRCDMPPKERNLPDLTQQFYTCERLIETHGLLESFDATIRSDDNTNVHFESEWISKAFEEDDMILQAGDFQDNHLEQTLVPKTCDKKIVETIPQWENNLELGLMDDWSPNLENAESKTIVKTILEDFCTSSDSVSSEMDLNSQDFMPFFRFRKKKIRTYERCWRHCGAFLKHATRCEMPTYKPNDEGDLSDGSELSVQEGISQLHPAPELENLNTSNRIRNNLLNLSAFFTQNLVHSDDEAEDNSQTNYLIAPEDATDSDSVAVNLRGYEAIHQIIMEFHTLRAKYKFSEISSSVEDLRGFPLKEEETTAETETDRSMNDAIERRDVVCRSAPDLTRIYSNTNKDLLLKIADCDENENSKNQQTNFDEESWHYDNDFFVNFQTQSLLKFENINETIKTRRNSDSTVKLSTPKAIKKPRNERKFPIEAANDNNENTIEEDEKSTTSHEVAYVSTQTTNLQLHHVTNQIADDAIESQITTDEILRQFESQKNCIRKQETSKLFENDFDCMMLSEWPLDEREFSKPDTCMSVVQSSFQQSTLTSSPQSSSSSRKPITRIENIPKNNEDMRKSSGFEQNIQRKVLCAGNEKDAKMGNCFTGFQTASRKVIFISEEAQKRIESVFANLPDFPDELNEQSTSRARQDNAASVPTPNLKVGQNKNESNADKCFTGFQTASKKPINVSEDSRKKIESVFAQLPDLPGELNEQGSTISDPPQSLRAEQTKNGFQTTSRKTINVSEESQKRIESVFANLPDSPDELNEQSTSRARQDNAASVPTPNLKVGQNKNESNADKCFTGFQTASKKPINVSEDSRKKIESVFAQLPDLPGELNEQGSTISDPPQSLRAEQTKNGFQTTSRKTINVSEESQKRIESVFANLPDFPDELNEQSTSRARQDNAASVPTPNLKVGQNKNESNANKCFTGFQTASKKPINVSEDSRKKIESVFAQLPDLPGELNEQGSTISDPPQSLRAEQTKNGFQTTSRKTINVSEESQKRIESVFANLPDSPDELNEQSTSRARQDNAASVPTPNLKVGQTKNESNADKCFTGFQTASKKPINVSEDSRKKIESVFAQLPDLPGELNKHGSTTSDPSQSLLIKNEKENRNCFTGFQTASRKAINVSEEAQKRIESIFAQLPDLPKEDKTKDAHKSKIEVQGNEKTENFDDFANIPLSEWIPDCDIKQQVEIRPEPEVSMKRRLQTDNSDHPIPKMIRKSYTMNESSTHTPTSIQSSESKLRRSHVLNCKIIGRRNLLSLTKRRRDSLRVESNIKRELSEENIETPVKLLSSVWAPKNILKPHTPQAGAQKPNATSTPQSMINQNSKTPNENLDFDFKRISWESNDDVRNNNNGHLSVTPTRLNNSDLNKSLKPQPSPQDRIENLSSCGDPPPLPQLVDSTRRSRRLGMSRRQRGCIIKN